MTEARWNDPEGSLEGVCETDEPRRISLVGTFGEGVRCETCRYWREHATARWGRCTRSLATEAMMHGMALDTKAEFWCAEWRS